VEPTLYFSNGLLNVVFNGANVYHQLDVFDVAGRLVLSESLHEDAQKLEIELNGSGTYIVHMSSASNQPFVKKVVSIEDQ
jgi:hypothetical protein